MRPRTCRQWTNYWGIMLILLSAAGCRSFGGVDAPPPVAGDGTCVPRELKKTALPPYVIEPPDVLLIEAIHVIPKQPYHLQPYDTIVIQVGNTPAEAPLSGIFPLGADGAVFLGPQYGFIPLWGKTVAEARKLLEEHLKRYLVEPEVFLNLNDCAARQKIAGPHLVAMDGTVTLGTYGNCSVIGMTVTQARMAVHDYLLQFFDSLEVSLEVNGYNSKVYYVVTQGAGLGDGVYRFPMTGNETVLDAVCQVNGLRPASSKRIWIARPTDVGMQRFEVAWDDITANGNARSNYQILPGDRIYVAQDPLIALDTTLAKMIAPVERVMGFSILGVGTITRFSGHVLEGGGNGNATF